MVRLFTVLCYALASGCVCGEQDTADTAPGESQEAPCVEWCPDVDGDGLGAPDLACAPQCMAPGFAPDMTTCVYVANCDDVVPLHKPVTPSSLMRSPLDRDGDGWSLKADCDDSRASVNHGAPEIPYNGRDDDCNRETPDDDLDCDRVLGHQDCDDTDPTVSQYWCADEDGDTEGDWYSTLPKGCTAKGVLAYVEPGVSATYYRCWPEGI